MIELVAYFALRLGVLACKILPEDFLVLLSRIFADLGFRLSHSFRKRSTQNLTLALGDRLRAREASAIVRGSLRNLLRSIVEVGLAINASPDEMRKKIPLIGREHLDAGSAKGRGVIVLSGHLGNFTLIAARLAIEGYPIYLLVHDSRTRRLQELRDRYRLKLGVKTVSARPRRQAFRRVVQVLRQKSIAVVIADEYRSGSGIYVPFFGRTVLARRGPATLALRTGAAVIPARMTREPDGGLKLIIEPELELSRSGAIQTDIRENTLRITQWMERSVRSYPDQWNWMNIHWQVASTAGLSPKSDIAGVDETTWERKQGESRRQATGRA